MSTDEIKVGRLARDFTAGADFTATSIRITRSDEKSFLCMIIPSPRSTNCGAAKFD